MTDPKHCRICLLVDRSGSMRATQKAAQDAIDEYVAEQRSRPGRTTIKIVQFDAPPDWEMGGADDTNWYTIHCPSVDPALVPPFVLHPRGRTALYDALILTIDEFGAELAALPEDQRPGTVILAILTDGQENASSATADS